MSSLESQARSIAGPSRRALAPVRFAIEGLDTVRALVTLTYVGTIMRLYGFARCHRLARKCAVAARVPTDETVERTCRAVDRAGIFYPKKAWCLQRSVTTVCLLRRRGVPAQLVIGARRMPFHAHAWVEVDGVVINDPPEIRSGSVVLERC